MVEPDTSCPTASPVESGTLRAPSSAVRPWSQRDAPRIDPFAPAISRASKESADASGGGTAAAAPWDLPRRCSFAPKGLALLAPRCADVTTPGRRYPGRVGRCCYAYLSITLRYPDGA